jgi:hypothetical protein
MAGKSSSAGKKARYGNYKSKGQYEKNRTRRLEKHKAAHPNDGVAANAKVKYRRKKPVADQGWVTGKVMFEMAAYVGCDKERNFSGMHSKATQQRIAQYMKLSRKATNEAQYAPKATSGKKSKK